MIIRHANKTDLIDIMVIIEKAKIYMKENKINQWSENYPNEDDFLTDLKENRLYVADIDGKVIGMAVLVLDGMQIIKTLMENGYLLENTE